MISEIDIRDWGAYPTKPIESKEQYEHYLKSYDWTAEMSDDHSVWDAAMRVRAYLMEAQRLFDPQSIIWNTHCHSLFANRE